MTDRIEVPLERWDTAKGDDVDAPHVQAFLTDILAVCQRHGYSIGHEDAHGAFLIGPYSVSDAQWLADAHLHGATP